VCAGRTEPQRSKKKKLTDFGERFFAGQPAAKAVQGLARLAEGEAEAVEEGGH